MKKEWNDVREFHEKFGHPCPDAPRMLDKKRSLSRAKWMNEEVAEFLVAEDIYEPDGKPHYNPKDGKVIKPDTWEDPAPKIRACIDAVIARKGK